MIDERGVSIVVGGQEYTLLLTTRAAKEIGKKYGGIEKLGEKLLDVEDEGDAYDELIGLILLLSNQSVMLHNLRNPDDPRPFLTADELELLTTPAELLSYNNAVNTAVIRGLTRNIASDTGGENLKNAEAV